MLDEITLHKMLIQNLPYSIQHTKTLSSFLHFSFQAILFYFFHNEHRQGQNKVAQN